MNENIKQPKRKIANLSTALSILVKKKHIGQRMKVSEMIHRQTGSKGSLSGDLSESELAELRKIPNVIDGDSICWENMIGLAVANGMLRKDAKKLSPKEWLGWWRAYQSKCVITEAVAVPNAVQQATDTQQAQSSRRGRPSVLLKALDKLLDNEVRCPIRKDKPSNEPTLQNWAEAIAEILTSSKGIKAAPSSIRNQLKGRWKFGNLQSKVGVNADRYWFCKAKRLNFRDE